MKKDEWIAQQSIVQRVRCCEWCGGLIFSMDVVSVDISFLSVRSLS